LFALRSGSIIALTVVVLSPHISVSDPPRLTFIMSTSTDAIEKWIKYVETIARETGLSSDPATRRSIDLIVSGEDPSENLKGVVNYSAPGTPAEVDQELRSLSTKVLDYWHQLKSRLIQNFEAIRTKWIHMASKRRKEVLLKAWPNMPPSHGPDWEKYREIGRTGLEDAATRDKYRGHFMFPNINQAALLSRDLLWIFLHARGYHVPAVFASVDFYYRLPSQLNLAVLEDIISSERTATEHHI
jgi:hypothetical protein